MSLPPGDAIPHPYHTNWPSRTTMEERIGLPIAESFWTFQPWGRKILIRLAPPETKVGSLFIPDNAQEQMGIGWIIKVGAQVGLYETGIDVCPLHPAELPGAKVIFSKWSGTPLMAHSKADDIEGDYLVIREGDVLGWLAHSLPMS